MQNVHSSTKASKKRRKRTRQGKTFITINAKSYREDGLTVLELRQLLGVRTRDTINEHLRSLGYFGLRVLNWEQAKNVLGSILWVRSNYGRHTRQQYAVLMQRGLAEPALKLWGIDLSQKLEELKDGYERQWNSGCGDPRTN